MAALKVRWRGGLGELFLGRVDHVWVVALTRPFKARRAFYEGSPGRCRAGISWAVGPQRPQSGTAILAVTAKDHRLEACATFIRVCPSRWWIHPGSFCRMSARRRGINKKRAFRDFQKALRALRCSA